MSTRDALDAADRCRALFLARTAGLSSSIRPRLCLATGGEGAGPALCCASSSRSTRARRSWWPSRVDKSNARVDILVRPEPCGGALDTVTSQAGAVARLTSVPSRLSATVKPRTPPRIQRRRPPTLNWGLHSARFAVGELLTQCLTQCI